jgi:glutamate 5-kinase
MVAAGGPLLLRSWMEQIVVLKREHNIEVIWVSSGAISSAVHRTDFKKTKSDWQLSEKQALSAIGQPILMDLYNLALHATGLLGAQVLLTAEDLGSKSRLTNLRATIEQLLKWKVIPILNENDAIATEEIKFGDNDSLSAKVAGALGANRLVILTDVDGLFEHDPRIHPHAKLISRVKAVNTKLLRAAGGASGSKHGTGGMLSKVKAAQVAIRKKVETVLVKGDVPSVLIKIAQNNFIGTVFEANR